MLPAHLVYSLRASWRGEDWLLALAGVHTTATGPSSTGPCVDGAGSAQVGWEHLQKSPALWVPGEYSTHQSPHGAEDPPSGGSWDQLQVQDLGCCPSLLPSYPLDTLLPIWEQVASGSQKDVPGVSDLKVKGEGKRTLLNGLLLGCCLKVGRPVQAGSCRPRHRVEGWLGRHGSSVPEGLGPEAPCQPMGNCARGFHRPPIPTVTRTSLKLVGSPRLRFQCG